MQAVVVAVKLLVELVVELVVLVVAVMVDGVAYYPFLDLPILALVAVVVVHPHLTLPEDQAALVS
jgi:hypothetical protein